jgi:hypothetical protein
MDDGKPLTMINCLSLFADVYNNKLSSLGSSNLIYNKVLWSYYFLWNL